MFFQAEEFGVKIGAVVFKIVFQELRLSEREEDLPPWFLDR